MKAMVLNDICSFDKGTKPLRLEDWRDPVPGGHEILIKVAACGVCHTELDEIEGRTPPPNFPIILGHEVVGRVAEKGREVTKFNIGDRVGVGWINSACEQCSYCLEGNENLCKDFKATGRDAHGGYAEYTVVLEGYAHKIPEIFSDIQAAPLLCAGAIGYRSLRLTGIKDGQNLGLTGFGASAHLVMKMVRKKYPGTKVFVFARSKKERDFAKELGAVWAGDTAEESPEKLDSIIDTTPAWKPIVEALKNLERGGRLVINAIRKEDGDKDCLLQVDYASHIWLEKEIKSVANVAGRDISEFLELAARIPIKPEVQEFALKEANQALSQLRAGNIRGAKVLRMN